MPTLGYIYYFGRANNGVSQDDLLLNIFLLIAAGNYESPYKWYMFIAGRGELKIEKLVKIFTITSFKEIRKYLK